ncbi:3539_t:CDS:2, partial [Dentiscutata erythropus]
QFTPKPRYLQTSVLLNNTKWYFFGGALGGTDDVDDIQTFDTNSFIWYDMIAAGDTIGERGFHSAVLVNDSKIIIYGGSTTNTGIVATPELAALDINTIPFNWIALNVSSDSAAPSKSLSLTGHSATLYDNFMIISYEWVSSLNRSNDQQTYINSSNAIIITVSVVCAVAFIVVCIVGFILYRKKRNVALGDNDGDTI